MVCLLLLLTTFALSGMNVEAAQPSKTSLTVNEVNGVPIHSAIIQKSPQRRPGIKMSPEYITIHNTGNRDFGATAAMHRNLLSYTTNTDTSWHYTVDDKEVYQHLPLNEIGYHAGDNGGRGNYQSIGIEICENMDGNYQKSEENGWKLAARLLYEYDLDISRLVTHNYWSGKDCPHNLLNNDYGSIGWDKFKNNVRLELERLSLENISDNSSKVDTLKMNVGESKSLAISYSNKEKEYTFGKSRNYQLTIQEKTNVVNNLIYLPDSEYQIGYKIDGMILENTTSNASENISEILQSLSKPQVEKQYYNTIAFNEEGSFKIQRTGVDRIRVKSEEGVVEFIAKASITGTPKITIKEEAFVEMSAFGMFNVKADNKHILWNIENKDIAEVKDGYIVGKIAGETYLVATIDDISIKRKIVVV